MPLMWSILTVLTIITALWIMSAKEATILPISALCIIGAIVLMIFA